MKIYFNTKFDTYATRKSAVTYIKISITDVNGMFAVIGIVDTGKVSIQSFPDVTGEHIYGLTSKNNYEEEKFYEKILPTLDKNMVDIFDKAMEELGRSAKNHIQKNKIGIDMQQEIYTGISDFKKRYNAAKAGKFVGVQPVVSDWKQIDDIVNELTAEELDNAITALNEEKSAIFNGREYRIIEEGNRAVLQYRVIGNSSNNESKIENKSVVQKIERKTIKKAFLVNDEGLNEFAKGNFYDYVRDDGVDFIIIKNDNGEERFLSKNRIKMVNVYSEPPVEFAEA